jgi:hypothetical protein
VEEHSCNPSTPTLRRQRQAELKFKASQGYKEKAYPKNKIKMKIMI